MKSLIFVLVVMFNSSAVCDEVAPKKTEKFVQKTDTIYRMPVPVLRDYKNGYDNYDLPSEKPAKPAKPKKSTKNKEVQK